MWQFLAPERGDPFWGAPGVPKIGFWTPHFFNAVFEETVDVNVGQGYKQTVPYKAAALNIKGVIARQLNDDKTAEELFNQALAIYPDFVLAKGNIEEMKKSSEKISGDTSK